MMGHCLSLEHLGQSAIVTLQQPPANLLTTECLYELVEQFGTLATNDSVRAAVITGAGDKFFSAGAALTQLLDGDLVAAEALADALLAALQAIRAFKGVTVAAINGYALGAGLECALVCDYIVAERGAMLGLPQVRVGLVPFAGGAKLLAEKVGASWARRIMLGGELISAEKACQIGLVEEVVAPGFAKIVALSLANKVAQQAPHASVEARRLLDESHTLSLAEHQQEAKRTFLSLIGSAEQLAGVAAFLEKRQPPWCDDDE